MATIFVIAFAALVFAFVRWIVPAPQGSDSGGQLPPPPVLIAAIGIAAVGLLLTSLINRIKGKISLWPFMLIVGSFSVTGILVENSWIRLGLLESAALLTVILVGLQCAENQPSLLI